VRQDFIGKFWITFGWVPLCSRWSTRVESAGTEADIAGAEKGGATGGLAAAFRDGGRLSRKLDGIVENKYDDNPRKMAEWKIAKHLEAAPERGQKEKKSEDNSQKQEGES